MGGALILPPLPLVPAAARIWVGYSGGCDSTVLLDLLRRSGRAGVRAVHVHHGLQPHADDWVRHCRRTCRRWDIPLRVLRVDVVEDGHGPEAAARAARRSAIAGLLRSGDLYVTAHHRDDQAETVLLRTLRGTGIAGLGAMRELEPFGAAQLWRPLLGVARSQLRAYASEAGLDWIEDPHNADVRYARAFLRRQVLPALGAHFPDAAASLARLAGHAQDAERLLAALAQSDAGSLRCGDGYDIPGLLALAAERRRNLLHHRWRELGLPPPPQAWYAELEHSVLRARADARPLLVCGDGEARRYRNRLYLMRRLPPPPCGQILRWSGARSLTLPAHCGSVQVSRRPPPGCEIRFGAGGHTLQIAEGAPPRSLARLCQQAGVPPWLRERMPLLWRQGELMAAGGLWHGAAARHLGLHMRWVHGLPGGTELSAGGRFT